MATLNASEMKELLETQVPEILKESPGFKEWLREFIHRQTVPRESFDERFDRIMNELAADRESQRRHWDEQERKWEEQNRKWEEQNRKWEEQNRKWEEQNHKWDETLKEIRSVKSKSEQSIGALGARWGVASEESFRAALRGILRDSFGVEVFSVNEFDDEGKVFGRPDQVELDIIIVNGTLILCELKSSISRGEMHLFERKARFYEQRHQRVADRRIVISPMVEARAQELAKALNIEVFSYAEDAVRHQD
jgi:hypothetical protein